jgi:hypothetical protein
LDLRTVDPISVFFCTDIADWMHSLAFQQQQQKTEQLDYIIGVEYAKKRTKQ